MLVGCYCVFGCCYDLFNVWQVFYFQVEQWNVGVVVGYVFDWGQQVVD